MARIRTIKPEFFLSETVAQLSLAAERSFVGMLTQADDEGRLRDSAPVLNGALWPHRPDHTVADMQSDIDEIVALGILCRYTVAGKRYLHFVTWKEHQKISHPSTRNLSPACPIHDGGGGGKPAKPTPDSPSLPFPEHPSPPMHDASEDDRAGANKMPEDAREEPETEASTSARSRGDSRGGDASTEESPESFRSPPEKLGRERKGKELVLSPRLSTEGGLGGTNKRKRASTPRAKPANAGVTRAPKKRVAKSAHTAPAAGSEDAEKDGDDMGIYDTPIAPFQDLRESGNVTRKKRPVGKNGVDPRFQEGVERIIEHLKTARSAIGIASRVTASWWTESQALLRGTPARPAFTSEQVCDIVDYAVHDKFWHSHITDPHSIVRHGLKIYTSDAFVQWSQANGRPEANRPRNKLIGQETGSRGGNRGRVRVDPDRKIDPSDYREEL